MSRTAVLKGTAAAGSPRRSPGADSLRAHHVLVLSLWCGLASGPLEVGAIVVRKRTYDLDPFYGMSRHFVWLIPLTDLLIFLGLGTACALVALCGRRGRWLASRLLCAVTLLPPLWAAFPRIYGPAGLLLALGIATRLVPALERHADGFRRCIVRTFPVLAVVALLLAASVWAGDRLKQRREEARPLPVTGSPNVLLIVLDTVAADHLSLHGYDRRHQPDLGRPGAARDSLRPGAGDLVVDTAVARQLLHGAVASRALRQLAHAAGRDSSHAGGVPGVPRLCHGRVRRQHGVLRRRHGAGPGFHHLPRITSSRSSSAFKTGGPDPSAPGGAEIGSIAF